MLSDANGYAEVKVLGLFVKDDPSAKVSLINFLISKIVLNTIKGYLQFMLNVVMELCYYSGVSYLIVIYKRECLCQKLHAVIKAQSIWFGNVGNLDQKEGKII